METTITTTFNIEALSEYKLCFVKWGFAYFTKKELSEQWGDDWNDAPYEHNAGEPYEDSEGDIFKLAYTSALETPEDRNYGNSPYSVKYLNDCHIPWLYDETTGAEIYAGVTPLDFISRIKDNKGRIYFPI